MNIWENAVITNKGLALLAKLTAGNTLAITKAETGSGYVTPGLLQQQTSVTSPKQTLSFRAASYPEEAICKLPCYLTNAGVSSGYTAKQVGIYANDPDEGEILFFIAQAGNNTGTEIPTEAEMAGYSAEWTFLFQYGQADGVNVTVDPSNTVSRQEMEQYVKENASSGPFYAVLSYNSTDGFAIDKTFADIITAFSEGRDIGLLEENGSNTRQYKLVEVNESSICFAYNSGVGALVVRVSDKNIVTQTGKVLLDDSHVGSEAAHPDIREIAENALSKAEAAVPKTCKINGLPLAGDIALSAHDVGAAPVYTYSTTDLEAGKSALETGTLYFVYE